MLSGTPSYYSLRSFSHISNSLRARRSSAPLLDPEQCDIRFLPAGCCHLNTSLHPHILTVRKHVWLLSVDFSAIWPLRAGWGETRTTHVLSHSLIPGDISDAHVYFHHLPPPLAIPRYYCHILFSSHSGSRAFMGRDFPLFLSYQCHISLFDFLAFTPFEVQRYEH